MGTSCASVVPNALLPGRNGASLLSERVSADSLRAGMLAGSGVVVGDTRVALGAPLGREMVAALQQAGEEVSVLVGWSAEPDAVGSVRSEARAAMLHSLFRQSLYAQPEDRARERAIGRQAKIAVDVAFATASWLPNVADIIVAYGFRRRFLTQAVESASMAAICAAALGWDDQRIYEVALGGLLCDIGMLFMDDRLLLKPGRFTPIERRLVEKHVEVGVRLLGPLRRVAPLTVRIVEEHQERFDGTGYPAGLTGPAFSLEGQIVGLTRRYLAAIVPSHDRPALEPHLAMDIIFAEADGLASASVVETFTRSVAPLPRGEVVGLTDGRMGVVKDVGEVPLRPVIEVRWNEAAQPVTPYDLDLRSARTLFAIPSHFV